MRVSVVVCTYNRADSLRDTLRCLRRQTHRDLEVVVVNGPSTDDTEDVIAEFDAQIKAVRNPLANLSVSRNLGIRAAAGDIVAFIDDDALPESNWLEQALSSFDDPEVGAVGGIVLDHTGMGMQYRFSAANRLGEATFPDEAPADQLNVPGAFTFPYVQGTNALFRRAVLERIGLFDEVFDFYLDETDVCCRVVDAGYIVRQRDDAAVHHRYLPSATRNASRVVTNWYPVVKNHTYFACKHALADRGPLEVLDSARDLITRLLADARYHEQTLATEPGHVERSIDACNRGLVDGLRLGLGRTATRDEPVALDPAPFLPYATTIAPDGLRIVLVSSGYAPHVTGGIARFITDVAPELAALGHDVRVFTRAFDGHSRVDREGDVWVHRLTLADSPGWLPEAPGPVDGFATAAANELQRIGGWWPADVVYGSLWDSELLGIARRADVAVVPMLATPLAEVADHEGWTDTHSPMHEQVSVLLGLERDLMRRATLVHAISDAIVATVDHHYPGALDHERLAVAHIGRADDFDAARHGSPASAEPYVLYVGRLEPRKGIDVLLDAVPLVLATHPSARFVVAGADRPSSEDHPSPTDAWRAAHPDAPVEFVGEVDDADLERLIAGAAVVLMPSRYESFGLVAVEAMMHGRPVIASDVGGIAELIVDGDTGLLVPVGDPAALAAAITRLLQAPAEAEAMALRAREHFSHALTAPAAARRLDTVLRAAALQPVSSRR